MPVQLFSMPTPVTPYQGFMSGMENAADIGLKQAQIPYVQSQTAMNQAMIPLLPMRIGAQYLGARGRLLGAINGVSNSYRDWLNTPTGAALAAKDPNLAASVYNNLQQQSGFLSNVGYNGFLNGMGGIPASGGMSGYGAYPMPQNVSPLRALLGRIFGGPSQMPPAGYGMGAPAPSAMPQGVVNPAAAQNSSAAPAPSSAPTQVAPNPNGFGVGQRLPLTNSQIQKLQRLENNANTFNTGAPPNPGNNSNPVNVAQNAYASQYATKNVPKSVQNLEYAGARANPSLQNAMQLLDQVDPNTGEQIGASRYLGPTGQLKLLKDQEEAHRTGITPPSLQNWENFDAAIENAQVQAAQLEKVPADQLSRTQFGKIFEVNPIMDTPALLKSRLQNAAKMMANAEKVNASDINAVTNNPQGLNSSMGMTQPISPEDQFQIPSFNNKKAFQNWYNNLTSDQQAIVRGKLKGT